MNDTNRSSNEKILETNHIIIDCFLNMQGSLFF